MSHTSKEKNVRHFGNFDFFIGLSTKGGGDKGEKNLYGTLNLKKNVLRLRKGTPAFKFYFDLKFFSLLLCMNTLSDVTRRPTNTFPFFCSTLAVSQL